MASKQQYRRGTTAAAFTLVELLLTVSLMLLLAGAVIINFGSLGRNARLEEGASHMETLFRYARAQAADSGRMVRIVFNSGASATGAITPNTTNLLPAVATTNSGVQVYWEPNPVGAPGRFECLPGAELLVEQVNDMVVVQAARPPGCLTNGCTTFSAATPDAPPATTSTNSLSSADTSTNTMPLTCYPDGSSDSMELVLSAAGGEDQRLAVVTLSGLTGSSRHRLFTPAADGVAPSVERLQIDPARDQ